MLNMQVNITKMFKNNSINPSNFKESFRSYDPLNPLEYQIIN